MRDLPQHNDFFQNAVKFIVDTDEYLAWFCSPDTNKPDSEFRETEFDRESLIGNSIPFSKVWVEFYDIKNAEPKSFKFEDDEPFVWAFGYDLNSNNFYYLRPDSDELVFLNYEALDSLGEDERKEALTNMAQLKFFSTYLETEYVNAHKKTISIGKRRNGKGKIVSRLSSYALIYRKQPVTKTSTKENSFSLDIEWQHRWKVKGHWRRIKGKGRGPDGKELDGFTWVREFEKGPQDKPLLNRPRVFKNKLPPGFSEASG